MPGYNVVALPWVAYDPADTMATYAAKMAAQVSDTHAVIVGLSLGGMLSVEIARQHPQWQVFIVSSAKTSEELGYDSNLLRWLSRHDVVPSYFFHTPNFFILYALGADTPETKQMLSDMIRSADPEFVRWCTHALLTWNNDSCPANVTHIHGTNDKVIDSARVKPDYWLQDGSHIMVYDRATEVGKIISDCLAG